MVMKNLGSKLKAAREAMQLSLKDVADATRLKATVLERMENGSFDFKLQDIYKRGFLRIYAAFLKMNVDDVMREYNTAMAMMPEEPRKKVPAFAQPEEPIAQFEEPAEEQSSEIDMTSKYIKLGGAFVLTILAIIVVVMIASSLTSNKSDAPVVADEKPVVSQVEVKPLMLTISSDADTYVTVAKKTNHNDVLFTGLIKSSEPKEFNLDEALFVRVTDASKIKMMRGSDVIYDKTQKGVKGFNITPR